MMVNIKKKSCWPPGPNLQPATCLPALALRGALLPPPGHSGVIPTAAQDARAGEEGLPPLLILTAALRRLNCVPGPLQSRSGAFSLSDHEVGSFVLNS